MTRAFDNPDNCVWHSAPLPCQECSWMESEDLRSRRDLARARYDYLVMKRVLGVPAWATFRMDEGVTKVLLWVDIQESEEATLFTKTEAEEVARTHNGIVVKGKENS